MAITLQFLNSNFKLLKFPARDFEVFYLSGQQALRGQDPYLEIGKDIVRNPPPVIPLFMSLALSPILVSQLIWFILSLLTFLLGSYFLFKALEDGDKSKVSLTHNWRVWLLYLSLVFSFFPFRYNLGSGQVNNFLFLFLVLSFYLLHKSKYFLSGFSLALGILLKITPVLILYPLIIMKENRLLKWTVLNLVFIILLTFPLAGLRTYQNYLAIPSSFFDFRLSVYTNQSVIGFLARTSQNYDINKFIYFALAIVALAALFQLSRKKVDNFKHSLASWNITILLMLIFAPFTWQYHFVIAIFPLTTTFYLLYKSQASLVYFFLIFLSYLFIGRNFKDPTSFMDLGLLGSVILSHVLLGAILLLLLNYQLLKKLK